MEIQYCSKNVSLDHKEVILNALDEFCDLLAIPKHLVHITHGAAAVLNGIRDTTNDIDINILGVNVWSMLQNLKMGLKVRHDMLGINPGADVIYIGQLQLHWQDEIDLTTEVSNIRGYLVSTKYQILVERIKLGRDKDRQEAIMLLPKHFNTLPKYLQERASILGWV